MIIPFVLFLLSVIFLIGSVAPRSRIGCNINSFALQFAVLFVLFGMVLLLFDVYFHGIFALVMGAFAIGDILRRNSPIPADHSGDHHLLTSPFTASIYFANLNIENGDVQRITRSIESADSDIVVLVEVASEIVGALTGDLADRYSECHHHVYREPGIEVLLLSRIPLSSVAEFSDSIRQGPLLWVTLAMESTEEVVLGIVHPYPPKKKEWFELRNQAFMQVADDVRETSGQVIVVGDFNAVPWDPYLLHIRIRTRLREGRGLFSLKGTWPTWFPLMQIPIDHFFYSSGLELTRFERGKRTGSDHHPIIASFRDKAPET